MFISAFRRANGTWLAQSCKGALAIPSPQQLSSSLAPFSTSRLESLRTRLQQEEAEAAASGSGEASAGVKITKSGGGGSALSAAAVGPGGLGDVLQLTTTTTTAPRKSKKQRQPKPKWLKVGDLRMTHTPPHKTRQTHTTLK